MFVHQSITSIEPLGPSPSFWSLEFHLRYFTKCLGRNLKNHPFFDFLAPGILVKLPLWVDLAGSLAGLVPGYLLGIPAGLLAQRLGPLRAFLAHGTGLGSFIVFLSG